MLEGLVVWILNTYIGEYFENLNTDQLSVGLLQGQVDLENIPLKKDSWNFFNWPLEIKAGVIGKIKILIPVYRLQSEPWVISVEKLSVILGPASSASFFKEHGTQDIEKKQRTLHSYEASWRGAQTKEDISSYTSFIDWRTYSASVFAKIAENIQLNIKDVQIRYEDDVCCDGRSFAFGIIIHSLTAHSTDKNWMPVFSGSMDKDLTWKLVKLQGLSVYWDSDAIMIGSFGMQEMMDLMEKNVEVCLTSEKFEKPHDFIISTTDVTARLRRNCSTSVLKSLQNPRIVCDIFLEKIPVFINQAQYQQLLDWEKGFNHLRLKWINRKFRPCTSVSQSPRNWWIYAASSHMKPVWEKNHSKTWNFVLERSKEMTDYVNIYHQYLNNSDSLSPEMKDRKQLIEAKLELEILIALQKLVMDKIDQENSAMLSTDKHFLSKGFLQWLFPSWVGWYTGSSNESRDSLDSESPLIKSSTLEEEILAALDNATDDVTLTKKDVLFAQISFTLQQGVFSLICETNSFDTKPDRTTSIIEMEFIDMTTRFETRPKLKSMLFEMKLGALYVHDRVFKDSCFPEVVTPLNKEVWLTSHSDDTISFFAQHSRQDSENKDEQPYFFQMLYEKNPHNVDADIRLSVKTKSLAITFNANLFEVLTNFFCDQNLMCSNDRIGFSSTARKHYESFKRQTKAELKHTLRNFFSHKKPSRQRWYILFEIAAPQLIIPLDIFDPNSPIVILDFGELHVHNSGKQRSQDFFSVNTTIEEEEEFHTPCSTPEEFPTSICCTDPVPPSHAVITNAVLELAYESIIIQLMNVQILVTTIKGSWKFAQLRGSSSLHVLNHSSLTVEVHRKLSMDEDGEHPDLAILVWLPKLNAHINEDKVSILTKSICIVHTYFSALFAVEKKSISNVESLSAAEIIYLPQQENVSSFITVDNFEKNFFFQIQFQVDDISFDLQNQSFSIAEVQISGLKSSFLKYFQQTKLLLSVDSLLVVDASQVFGPDFELLAASHKSFSMNSSSGRLENHISLITSHGYTSSLPFSDKTYVQLPNSNNLPFKDPCDDALIHVIVQISNSAKDESDCMAAVNFNNLDAIANQDTITHLIDLMKRITRYDAVVQKVTAPLIEEDSFLGLESSAQNVIYSRFQKMNVDLNFNSLSLLLLRVVNKECKDRNLATMSLCNFSVRVQIVPNNFEIKGFLGSIQLHDLMNAQSNFQTILSFSPERAVNAKSKKLCSSTDESTKQSHALSFQIMKMSGSSLECNTISYCRDTFSDVHLCVQMASICYTHCPDFLVEFIKSVTEFKNYFKVFTSSVKSAAAEVAKGIASTGFESINKSWKISSSDKIESSLFDLRCDITLKSPVLILPLPASSSEAFVAHLGHFTACNTVSNFSHVGVKDFASLSPRADRKFDDRMVININGISIFYVNLSAYFDQKNLTDDKPVINIHGCQYLGHIILDNTSVDINIDPFQAAVIHRHFPSARGYYNKAVNITGKVCCPIKVFLNKLHYEKILNLWEELLNPKYVNFSLNSLEEDCPCYEDLCSSECPPCNASERKTFPLYFIIIFHSQSMQLEIIEESSEKGSSFRITMKEFILSYKHGDEETMLKVSLDTLMLVDLLGQFEPSSVMPLVYWRQNHENYHLEKDDTKIGCFIGMSSPQKYIENLPKSMICKKPMLQVTIIISSAVSATGKMVRYYMPVNFEGIEILFNLHSWINLLNFFSTHVKPSSSISRYNKFASLSSGKISSTFEIDLMIGNLSIRLAKPAYHLASLDFIGFSSWIFRHQHCFKVEGKLDSIVIKDLTSFGKVYPERLITREANSLTYRISSCKKPAEIESEYTRQNIHVMVETKPILYVHTHRFITEIVVFFSYFQEKQRIIASEMMVSSKEYPCFSYFDIHIQSPSIIIPPNAEARNSFVINLSDIILTNKIYFFPDGNISMDFCETSAEYVAHKASGIKSDVIRKDEIKIKLTDVDLNSSYNDYFYHGKLSSNDITNISSSSLLFPYVIISEKCLLQDKFALELLVELNVGSADASLKGPEILLKGTLSGVKLILGFQEYRMFREIICGNFGEDLEECIYDPCKEIGQFVLMDTDKEVIPKFAIHMHLVDSSLELNWNHITQANFAKFDFVRSFFSYVVNSDNSKDIDLVLNEIRVTDMRYMDFPANNRPNVFSDIIFQTRNVCCNTLFQAEVHYRINHESTKLTFLLNDIRVMGIIDFLISTYGFLTSSLSDDKKEDPPEKSKQELLKSSMELKINFINTEFIFIESPAKFDSVAFVIKSTVLICWKPYSQEKIFSCSLQDFQISSCIHGIEDDTSWVIIEPVNIVMDFINKKSCFIPLANDVNIASLEASFSNIYCHISVPIMKTAVKIFNDIKSFLRGSKMNSQVHSTNFSDANVQTLQNLGFSIPDCKHALHICKNDVNDAALWLTQNAKPAEQDFVSNSDSSSNKSASQEGWHGMQICSSEIRFNRIDVSLIHELRDVFLPALKLNFSEGTVFQNILGHQEGHVSVSFGLSYYNASISGWEPLIEFFRLKTNWNFSPEHIGDSQKVFANFMSNDVLNLNITSSFLSLSETVRSSYKAELDCSQENESFLQNRIKFNRLKQLPCILKNATGIKLKFKTRVITAHRYICLKDQEINGSTEYNDEFEILEPGQFAHLLFPLYNERFYERNFDASFHMLLHQVVVQIEGFTSYTPVTVNKVGVFFRQAEPLSVCQSFSHGAAVFRIHLEQGIQKTVTVESVLSVRNLDDNDLDVKLILPTSSQTFSGQEHLICIKPGETVSLPMQFVNAELFIRPKYKSVFFCDEPILWERIRMLSKQECLVLLCKPYERPDYCYRLCASVQTISNHCTRYCLDHKRKSQEPHSEISPHGHIIDISSCFQIVNLLPCEITYEIREFQLSGHMKPGEKRSLCYVDVGKCFHFKIAFENFKQSKEAVISLTIPQFPSYLTLFDRKKRPLNINLKVLPLLKDAFKMYLYVQYWIVNKTGIPIVIKQEGAENEAAGQFSEHEIARNISPLMFSFADKEASAMCSMRVGKFLHSEGVPAWSARFHLEKGITCRRLHVVTRSSRPDWVYSVGIDITSGQGIYEDTIVVILTPRYQLDNRSQQKLEFCQKVSVKEVGESILSATPYCSLPFHWSCIDKDNFLSVRIADMSQCCWSGGFSIDKVQSFHLNMRDSNGVLHFLKTEVVLHKATFHIIFTDAESFPPPIRIDNYSEVPVMYYQTNVMEERLKTTVRPHSSVPYAWDDPMLPPYITCCAPGGSSATYNTNIFSEGSQLFYENFIYIVLSGTFIKQDFKNILQSNVPLEITQSIAEQELVLDVPSGTRVVLNKMEAGKRSQLWRMTSSGLLQHEGSGPPSDLSKSYSEITSPQRLVLDIAAVCPQPGEFTPLMLRKPDARRHLTQTWKFTTDGRLCCGYANLCVQSEGNHLGLRSGSSVVLGPVVKYSPIMISEGIPIDQAVSRKKLREGSGVLCVSIVPDGPTRVIKITDLKQKANVLHSSEKEENQCFNNPSGFNDAMLKTQYELEIKLFLRLQGLGLSVVNHVNEDLVYVLLKDINVELSKSATAFILDGSVKKFEVDSQLRERERNVLVFATPCNKLDSEHHLPDVHFIVHKVNANLANAEIFKHFIVTVKNLTIHLEEYLLMKVLQFYDSFASSLSTKSPFDSNDFQNSLFRHSATDCRYYFGTLKISLQQVRLSVFTTSSLSEDLQYIKCKTGLHLVRFEDAEIELDPFLQVHPFETVDFIMENVFNHYKEELKSQAAKILGSVDFLGNPLGLVNDFTDGLSELIHEGNVGGLIKNVAHGLSDSAVKLSETLSDGLGVVAIDEKHQIMRKQIRQGCNSPNSSGNDHLVAGIQGLGIGLLGGVTSLFTQTYEGLSQEGIQGFLSGFGKGLVGTVTKPAIGFLDLASGAASAVRDTSKRNSHSSKACLRPPRLYVGYNYMLPQYTLKQAADQELFYKLNNRDFSELFISKETIRSETEEMHVLVSSKSIFFYNNAEFSSGNIVLTVLIEDIISCTYVCCTWGTSAEIRHYIQLNIKDSCYSRVQSTSWPRMGADIPEGEEWSFKKPYFRCDTKEIAERVLMQINFSRYMLEERKCNIY